MQKQKFRTAVIIILYNPRVEQLKRCIKSLEIANTDIYFYLNSPLEDEVGRYLNQFTNLYGEGINIGLGKATNILLDVVEANNYNFAVISDQDTNYPSSYVSAMTSDRLPGAVRVPLWQQQSSGKVGGFYTVSDNKIHYCKRVGYGDEVLFSIASGMVLSMKDIDGVRFDESLFIDSVDTEFCMRITGMGQKIIVNTELTLQHDLGDGVVRIFGKLFTKRNSLRDFYITRNAVHLFFRPPPIPHLSIALRLFFLKLASKHIIISTLTSKHKLNNLVCQCTAVLHGMRRKLGRYE